VTLVGSIFTELANILNESLASAFDSQVLRSFLEQTTIGRTFLAQLFFALITALIASQSKKVGAIYWVLGLMMISAILPVFKATPVVLATTASRLVL